MANKLTNPGRTKSMTIDSDANGDYFVLPNGKKWYCLTVAITANSTATTAAAGSLGQTSHATGLNSIFRSDGSKWQALA